MSGARGHPYIKSFFFFPALVGPQASSALSLTNRGAGGTPDCALLCGRTASSVRGHLLSSRRCTIGLQREESG